jgi:hypothetical protein
MVDQLRMTGLDTGPLLISNPTVSVILAALQGEIRALGAICDQDRDPRRAAASSLVLVITSEVIEQGAERGRSSRDDALELITDPIIVGLDTLRVTVERESGAVDRPFEGRDEAPRRSVLPHRAQVDLVGAKLLKVALIGVGA